MSTIQLSGELMNDIYEVLVKHDNAVSNDVGIGIQYLAAITGYLTAGLKQWSAEDKQEFLEQLFQFANHVMSEQSGSSPAPAAAPADNNAFGVWKPDSQ